MRSANGSAFIEQSLTHADPEYDPQARRERYLRTRELKGRQPGQGNTPGDVRERRLDGVVGPRPTPRRRGNEPEAEGEESEQGQSVTEARVEALKVRLTKLRKVLAELTKQAQARSGVEPEPPAPKDPKSSSDLTAKQKADAAERSKKYYEENKDSISDQAKQLEAKIESVKEKIRQMRAELELVRRRRSPQRTGSVGVGTIPRRMEGDSQNES